MQPKSINRRAAMVSGGSFLVAMSAPQETFSQSTTGNPPEVELVDEPTRGFYGVYDVDTFGPAALREVERDFIFPTGVNVPAGYGIDVSHHTKEVPWEKLQTSKVSYVYIKASQSINGRDGKFVEFWQGAKTAGIPFGAYHFLTAGAPGHAQSDYFLKRLKEVDGFAKGQLQPVVDLEWDNYGPDFKRVVIGKNQRGDDVFKDYWDAMTKSDIVATVNDCVAGIIKSTPSLQLKPIIYTNRSWWDSHIPSGTVFPNCTVWISDYRKQSYLNKSPRSVQGHDYFIWQFTDQARIVVGNRTYGPFDSNKLVFGGIGHISIA